MGYYNLLLAPLNSPNWPLLIYAGLVFIVVAGVLLLSYVLGEKHHAKHMHEIYESGIKTTGDARLRFSSQYDIVAMFFVIFDLEAAFLVAWAVLFNLNGWLAYTAYTGGVVLISILVAVLIN